MLTERGKVALRGDVALKILPSLMLRHKEEGYTDISAMYEAWSLAKQFLEIKDLIASQEAPSTSLKCICDWKINGGEIRSGNYTYQRSHVDNCPVHEGRMKC